MPTPSTADLRRRRLTFRVRTLLGFVLLAACGLGWVVQHARTQREAVAVIVRSGGHVYYDWEVTEVRRWDGSSLARDPRRKPFWPSWLLNSLGPDYFGHVRVADAEAREADVLRSVGRLGRLDKLSISGPHIETGMDHLRGLTGLRSLSIRTRGPISGRGLRHLKGLTRLEHLEIPIGDTRLTDDDLAFLTGLVELRHLRIRSSRITSAGLVHLRGMTHLARLDLSDSGVDNLAPIRHLTGLRRLRLARTPVDDGGLAPIAELTNLQEVDLTRATRLTDAGMASLCGLRSLTYLILMNTTIGDEGAVHLSKLPSLAELGLKETAITDAALVHLGRLSSLRNVGLQGTRVTDAGLRYLDGLTGLLGLGVQNTRVTAEGAAALEAALPRVRVVRSPRPTARREGPSS